MDSIGAIKFKACRDCDTLHEVQSIPFGSQATCSHCESVLYRPKEHSVEYALPLIIGGLILFIPANIYPIMTIEVLGRSNGNTLLAGVLELFREGLWIVGSFVLLTSIVIPLFKLLGMFVIIVQLHFNRAPPYLPVLYRMVKTVHLWGMVEVYILAALISYVKLSDIANLHIGIGFWAFSGLLVCVAFVSTMVNDYVIWEKMESLR